MRTTLITTMLASTLALASAHALAASKESQTFITKAIEGNLAEIEMGKFAQSQGQSEDVKSFGAMLVQDHTDSNEKATNVAQELGVTAPAQISKAHQQDHDKLAKLSGSKFDKEFAQHMVADHRKDISEFTKQSKMKGEDPTVSFASETLPVLEKHLKAAQQLESSKK